MIGNTRIDLVSVQREIRLECAQNLEKLGVLKSGREMRTNKTA